MEPPFALRRQGGPRIDDFSSDVIHAGFVVERLREGYGDDLWASPEGFKRERELAS